ncbi:MAG: GNAT family N-acetyltransferase [Alphaproteobacteria bacterium]
MTTSRHIEILPLDPSHDRAAFSCGNPELDEYLKRRARQDQARNVANTWLATWRGSRDIIGYYTLSNYSIDLGELPADTARRLPRYPMIPAALIGRMAVVSTLQGTGRVGPMLLMDAFKKVLHISQTSAVFAVVVHAKTNRVASFYRRHDFIPLDRDPLTLFVSVGTISKLGL